MAQTAALYVNKMKINPDVLVPQISAWLSARGWQSVVWYTGRQGSESGYPFDEQEIGFVLSLGGDGTVLEAAREAARHKVPVLGVNYGQLGFLCEVEQGDIFTALQRILDNDYMVEERLMLTACQLNQETSPVFSALNDVVFARQGTDAMMSFELRLSGEPIASPPCDGLIIATPTGSTAYSLSAGGSIVSPDVEAILITYLAAHALSTRPMVVSHKDVLDVTVASPHGGRVSVDGQGVLSLLPGETVRIMASEVKARFIRFAGTNFPKMIREKLR
ncbi:MAG: NAD(+)/NADH kinase [Peptococcaceae bacterium]|nr:NAD(+)/NADH kinase [Peptococcaceae bacterium]